MADRNSIGIASVTNERDDWRREDAWRRDRESGVHRGSDTASMRWSDRPDDQRP